MFSKLQSEETHCYYGSENPIEDFNKFKSHFVTIEAAGGLVYNDKNQTLWIHRLGIWDLPKGKIEANENVKVAATREIEEECGISDPVIIDEFGKSFHMYPLKGNVIFKITHWFTMKYSGSEKLTPQLEEDITEVKWVDSDDLNQKINSTYPSISELFKP